MTRQGVVEAFGVDHLDHPRVARHVPRHVVDHPRQDGRLGQATGLDDREVQAQLGTREPGEGLAELTGVDLAAHAAVGERDHGVHPPGDGGGVHVDLAEVVDDRGDAQPRRAGQQVVEQGGLARAQVPGEDEHGQGLTGGAVRVVRPATAPGEVPVPQSVVQRRHSGFRFSANADMPSVWSSVANSA